MNGVIIGERAEMSRRVWAVCDFSNRIRIDDIRKVLRAQIIAPLSLFLSISLSFLFKQLPSERQMCCLGNLSSCVICLIFIVLYIALPWQQGRE